MSLPVTDRELLELAAKAAGLSIWKYGKTDGAFINNRAEAWSPLTNDGDALRLAVMLGLTIAPANGSRGDIVEVYSHSSLMGTSADGKAESHDGDPFAATRRAIVRAAAAIGESMQ